MRRLTVSLVLAAALAAACGGAEREDARVPAPASTGPTEAQLVFRERILKEIRQGKYTCHCTGALRARERIEKGLADAP